MSRKETIPCLVGFAGMKGGKYQLVTHKWIRTKKELKPYLKLFPDQNV